jgi:hypothetical protein
MFEQFFQGPAPAFRLVHQVAIVVPVDWCLHTLDLPEFTGLIFAASAGFLRAAREVRRINLDERPAFALAKPPGVAARALHLADNGELSERLAGDIPARSRHDKPL